VALLAEQRRLMAEGIVLRGSHPVERSFIVNVRNPELGSLPENATGGTKVRLKPREVGSASWDDALSIEVTAPASLLELRVEPVTVRTLYLAGDSTVSDQAVAPNASWGQFLTRYFRDDVAVANHAESGETLKSFVTEQRFDKLLGVLRAGDWVMLQFGHNDQKAQWPQTYVDALSTYRSWLRTYIAEIRRRDATPMLVTSPERRNFDTEGRIRPTLAEYAQAMRIVAREEKVALIDLNLLSVRLYEALGPAVAPRAFADGGDDKTHHNDYGARQLARAVIEGLRLADPRLTGGLERHVAADAGTLDLAQPPLPD
jgi:lysophospholipase L1-like esterase